MHSNGGSQRGARQSSDGENATPLSTQEKLALASWGLPEKVLQHYARKGITHMFKWQLECLTVGKVLEGGNLVYSAPTSAGKTLVAEILMSQTVFERNKKVILILPFVSVVREKMFYFQNMFSHSGIKVEGFMGGHTPSAGFRQIHVAVCTIEKANSILNKLLEDKSFNGLGLVVVDELHLLGDPYRGYLLELLLTKLKYMSSKSGTNIQIVGMSATLPNLKVLADWLKADLYYSSFRPVPLLETLKCGNSIYDKKLNKLRDLEPIRSEVPDGPDHIGQLCFETVKNGHSVLIFCPSKSWCENLADEIASFFKQNICSPSAVADDTPGSILREQLNLESINQVIRHLKMTPVGLDADLQRTVSYGVAFHHAGLTLDERDIVEGSFRKGSIRVLCATSTLSSGVNLPARRVIIRSPMAFGKPMDILAYRQMIGRAGRMGVDSEGESIIICKSNEKPICQQIMTSNLKPIESCLGRGPMSSSLKRALLEIVASGVASTPEDVKEYADCTFLASSSKHDIENPIQSCIRFLEENEFIRLQENGSIYAATPLGQACLASSMPPDEGLSLFRELQRARRCFVLDTDLHIIYQVTPYSVSEQWTKLNWLHVLNVFENLPESMKRVGELVGVEESFLVRVVKGSLNGDAVENRIKLSIHRRFYTSLALQDLVNEVPLTEVAEKYQCNKGVLQSLQQSAATYAGMVTEFTRRLGWSSVELIFSQFQERLQFGVQRELCELMRLPMLNVIRARALYNAGYTNLAALANAAVADLENVLHAATPFQSKKEIAGETSFERNQRNKLQTIWITGSADLSVRRAAELVVEEARNAIEMELGVDGANWGNPEHHRSSHRTFDSSLFDDSKDEIRPRNSCGPYPRNGLTEGEESFRNAASIFDSSIASGDARDGERNFELAKENSNDASSRDLSAHASRIQGSKPCASGEGVSEWKVGIVNDSQDLTVTFQNHSSDLTDPQQHSLKRSLLKNGCYEADGGTLTYVHFPGTVKVEKAEQASSLHLATEEDNSRKMDLFEGSCVGKVEESDCDSTGSESSVELVYEKSKSNEMFASEKFNGGDMFEIPEGPAAVKKSFYSGPNGGRRSRESKNVEFNADLFSQSLTFDTQMEKVLGADTMAEQRSDEKKLANSFNSDDLGFVSDASPPRARQMAKPESSRGDVDVGRRNLLNRDEPEMSPCDKEDSLNKSLSERIKRKACISNSPDFIIGSDDSWIEERHVSKKPKLLKNTSTPSNAANALSANFESQGSDDDDEIMPTLYCKNSGRPPERRSPNGRSPGLSNPIESPCSRNASGEETTSRRTFIRRDGRISRNGRRNRSSGRSLTHPRRCGANRDELNWMKIGGKNRALDVPAKTKWDSINIIDVSATDEEFKSFREELKLQNIVGLALGCAGGIAKERKRSIGLKIIKNKTEKGKETTPAFRFGDLILDGIAIYFRGGNDVFYVSFSGGGATKATDFLNDLSAQKKFLRLYDAKDQVKLLHRFASVFLEGRYQDPKTGHWLASRSWKEKSFSSIATSYIPETSKLIAQLGPSPGFSGPGSAAKSSTCPKLRACTEAFVSFHVMERQLTLLRRKSLLRLFEEVEMPLIPCLAEMELTGFRVDRDKLNDIKSKLDSMQSRLSDKAYECASHKFSLTSPAAISKVLFKDLQLGGSAATTASTKVTRRPSTNKEALQALAAETNHPLPDLILLWRKIQAVLTKVLSPLFRIDPETSRLFSVSQLLTVTGRLSMQEPNLQNVPRNFTVTLDGEDRVISVREIFVASEGCTLVSADYSQIELRLLAHLSGDEDLVDAINSSSDVFVNVASRIYDIPGSSVDDELRQKAKQTCYGIIYGIGARALSHQLKIDESGAASLMEDFKSKYKGVGRYLDSVVRDCREKGYVTSLFGRRRYLSYIGDTNPAIRSEAERQAINTTIQGSAADLIKIAIIRIREKLKALNKGNITANLLLHMHDELLFEVSHSYADAMAVILKETMEKVLPLKVATPVKLHVGPSWGQLHPIDA